jgi:hypothetical protein
LTEITSTAHQLISEAGLEASANPADYNDHRFIKQDQHFVGMLDDNWTDDDDNPEDGEQGHSPDAIDDARVHAICH